MNKAYQMSDLEHNAFIEHCKATETYKKIPLRTYSVHDEDLFRAKGEMAIEDEDRYYGDCANHRYDEFGEYLDDYFKDGKFYIFEKVKLVTTKGYDKNAHTRL